MPSFPQQNVDAGDCQENWEAAAATLLGKPDYKFLVANDGGPALGVGTYTSLNNFSFTYSTGSKSVKAFLLWNARFDTGTAAWSFIISKLLITPTPTFRLGTPDSVTSALNWLHGAGPAGVHCRGEDFMVLAPNTTYTFQVQGLSQGGVAFWQASTNENYLAGLFWPQ